MIYEKKQDIWTVALFSNSTKIKITKKNEKMKE